MTRSVATRTIVKSAAAKSVAAKPVVGKLAVGKTAVTMRELQKMSAATIKALPHALPIKSGDETVGLLMPLRQPDPERMKDVLDRIERHHAALSPAVREELARLVGEID